MKILSIIKKNLKFLIRAKASSLIIIYGPLLLIFLVGVAFDNSQFQNVVIGVYSDNYSELTNTFVSHIEQSQFKTIKSSSEQDCINDIKSGTLQMCIVFPPNMSLKSNKTNEVVFYVDYSKINLVWVVMDMVSSSLSEKSKEISIDLTKIVVDQLQLTNQILNSNKQLINNLISSSNKASKDINSVYSSLDVMDLTMNLADFPTSKMSSQQSSIKYKVDSLNHDLTKLISSADSAKDDIEKDSEDIIATQTSNDTTIYQKANDIYDTIVDFGSDISTASSDKDEHYNSLSSYLTDLKASIATTDSKLNSLNSKLNSASSTKTEASIKLKTVEKNIKNDNTHLINLRASIENITKNIESIEVKSPETIASPVVTRINPIVAEKTHLNYIFPSLIVVLIMFISVLLGSTVVTMEKSSRAHFRNIIAPISQIKFVFANYLTNLFLIFIQILLIIVIASFFFQTQVFDQMHILLLFLFIISSFFILLGLLIGQIFKSEEISTVASVVIITLMLLLSNLILPLESMSPILMKIATYNPFVMSVFLMRQSLIFNAPLSFSLSQIIYMIGAVLLILILDIIIVKTQQRKRIRKSKEKKTETSRITKI